MFAEYVQLMLLICYEMNSSEANDTGTCYAGAALWIILHQGKRSAINIKPWCKNQRQSQQDMRKTNAWEINVRFEFNCHYTNLQSSDQMMSVICLSQILPQIPRQTKREILRNYRDLSKSVILKL